MKDQDMKQFKKKATVKNVLKGGKNQGQNTLAEEILGQDKWKQNIVDGLLGVQRIKKTMQTEDGKVYLQEFVRMEDKTGQWFMVKDLSETQWQELKSNGRFNEECAKDVLTTLNAGVNNNISLSNMSKDQINNVGEHMVRSVDNMLRSNKEKYGIENAEEIEWIMDNIIVPNVLAGLSKAKGGKFIKELLSQTNLVGTLDDEEEEDNGGILNRG